MVETGHFALVLAFAGGAVLTMLASTMIPEAYEEGGKLVGIVTVLGFMLGAQVWLNSFFLSILGLGRSNRPPVEAV